MPRTGTVCILFAAVAAAGLLTMRLAFPHEKPEKPQEEKVVKLPKPKLKGKMSLEEAIKKRRCVRRYKDKALSLEQLSQLLWAANGVTGRKSYYRAAPSAGALHPLDFYAVVGKGSVTGLEEGVYHYNPVKHSVTRVTRGDLRGGLRKAALGQRQVETAEIVVVVTVEYKRSTKKYGNRGVRYALMDAGFASENLFLQLQTLGLTACVVGAFRDAEVSKLLTLPRAHEPLLLLSIGYPE